MRSTEMTIEDMIKGLVRAAEFREQEDGGEVWDDAVRAALAKARSIGWGRNRTGTLDTRHLPSILVKLDEGVMFDRATDGASGWDLRAQVGLPREIPAGTRFFFRTGVRVQVPPGWEGQVRPRSGLARNHGLLPATGTIDADYRGEIGVTLFNLGQTTYTVIPGERIAQLVFAPLACPQVSASVRVVGVDEELGKTKRGESGHGSTGR